MEARKGSNNDPPRLFYSLVSFSYFLADLRGKALIYCRASNLGSSASHFQDFVSIVWLSWLFKTHFLGLFLLDPQGLETQPV